MKQDISRLLKSLWIRACRWDKIPADTKFSVFSRENPYAERHDRIAGLFMAARSRKLL
jgi:hypothetical protein